MKVRDLHGTIPTTATSSSQHSAQPGTAGPYVRLERSRQSARECRARKKLRYQYLEELVSHREKAVITLREEFAKQYMALYRDLEEGNYPAEVEMLPSNDQQSAVLNRT